MNTAANDTTAHTTSLLGSLIDGGGADAFRVKLRESAAKATASMLVERFVADMVGLQRSVEGALAVELRCIDDATAPLQETMQSMVAGEFGKPGVESNIIILLASSSNGSGRYLKKLAEDIGREERKLVCFYTVFSVDGEARPWVLRPGMSMPMGKIVHGAATKKILGEDVNPVAVPEAAQPVHIRVKWQDCPEGGLVVLVPASLTVAELRETTELQYPGLTMAFVDGPGENESVAVMCRTEITR